MPQKDMIGNSLMLPKERDRTSQQQETQEGSRLAQTVLKPHSRSQQRRLRRQKHKPRRYQPIVIVETETEVLVIDAEVLLAMLLVGGARK
jgi:hypothetical protein